jgi:hypothetical protein
MRNAPPDNALPAPSATSFPDHVAEGEFNFEEFSHEEQQDQIREALYYENKKQQNAAKKQKQKERKEAQKQKKAKEEGAKMRKRMQKKLEKEQKDKQKDKQLKRKEMDEADERAPKKGRQHVETEAGRQRRFEQQKQKVRRWRAQLQEEEQRVCLQEEANDSDGDDGWSPTMKKVRQHTVDLERYRFPADQDEVSSE